MQTSVNFEDCVSHVYDCKLTTGFKAADLGSAQWVLCCCQGGPTRHANNLTHIVHTEA